MTLPESWETAVNEAHEAMHNRDYYEIRLTSNMGNAHLRLRDGKMQLKLDGDEFKDLPTTISGMRFELNKLFDTAEAATEASGEEKESDVKVGSWVYVRPTINKPSAGKFNRGGNSLRKAFSNPTDEPIEINFDSDTLVYFHKSGGKKFVWISFDKRETWTDIRNDDAQTCINTIERLMQARLEFVRAAVTAKDDVTFTTKEGGVMALNGDKDVLWCQKISEEETTTKYIMYVPPSSAASASTAEQVQAPSSTDWGAMQSVAQERLAAEVPDESEIKKAVNKMMATKYLLMSKS